MERGKVGAGGPSLDESKGCTSAPILILVHIISFFYSLALISQGEYAYLDTRGHAFFT